MGAGEGSMPGSGAGGGDLLARGPEPILQPLCSPKVSGSATWRWGLPSLLCVGSPHRADNRQSRQPALGAGKSQARTPSARGVQRRGASRSSGGWERAAVPGPGRRSILQAGEAGGQCVGRAEPLQPGQVSPADPSCAAPTLSAPVPRAPAAARPRLVVPAGLASARSCGVQPCSPVLQRQPRSFPRLQRQVPPATCGSPPTTPEMPQAGTGSGRAFPCQSPAQLLTSRRSHGATDPAVAQSRARSHFRNRRISLPPIRSLEGGEQGWVSEYPCPAPAPADIFRQASGWQAGIPNEAWPHKPLSLMLLEPRDVAWGQKRLGRPPHGVGPPHRWCSDPCPGWSQDGLRCLVREGGPGRGDSCRGWDTGPLHSLGRPPSSSPSRRVQRLSTYLISSPAIRLAIMGPTQ